MVGIGGGGDRWWWGVGIGGGVLSNRTHMLLCSCHHTTVL